MDSIKRFRSEGKIEIKQQAKNRSFIDATEEWFNLATFSKYSYHFDWMGIPIIQYPQDIIAMQEIVFYLKPDLIIETGIARGGSLIFYSSLLELNATCGGPVDGRVVGIDIDIRPHNRELIVEHPLAHRITMFEGSSIDSNIISSVTDLATNSACVLVCLDSLHSHDHVLAELEAYAPLTTVGSYCVVFDTITEMLPQSYFDLAERHCGIGNSPMTARNQFLADHPEFQVDSSISDKLMITVAPGGYLKRVM